MEIVLGFLLGVVGNLLAAPLWELLADRFYRISGARPFSIEGVWLAEFQPPSPEGSHTIELIHFRQRRDKVRITIENYNSRRNEVLVLTGQGLYRSGVLTMIYYFPGGNRQDVGCLLLRTTTDGLTIEPVLTGNYYQFIDRTSTAARKFLRAPLILTKVLTNKSRIRRFFGGLTFQSYDEIAKQKDALRQTNQMTV